MTTGGWLRPFDGRKGLRERGERTNFYGHIVQIFYGESGSPQNADIIETKRSHRLVPFLSIVLVLEEALPLVVIYAPFLLPSTCKLPSQQRRIDSIADQKRAKALLLANDALSTSNTAITSLLSAKDSHPTVVRAIARYECSRAGVSPFFHILLTGCLVSRGTSQRRFNTSLLPAASEPSPHKMRKYPKTFIMA